MFEYESAPRNRIAVSHLNTFITRRHEDVWWIENTTFLSLYIGRLYG